MRVPTQSNSSSHLSSCAPSAYVIDQGSRIRGLFGRAALSDVLQVVLLELVQRRVVLCLLCDEKMMDVSSSRRCCLHRQVSTFVCRLLPEWYSQIYQRQCQARHRPGRRHKAASLARPSRGCAPGAVEESGQSDGDSCESWLQLKAVVL